MLRFKFILLRLIVYCVMHCRWFCHGLSR